MKTADEMFRELGYEKVEPTKTGNTLPIAQYTKIDFPEYYVIKVSKNGEFIKVFPIMDEMIGFTSDEILACAQLVKELNEKYYSN